MAGSPEKAAYMTFGHAVYPVDDMGEEEAVFFSHVPIDEPPVYVGSTADVDFPDDVVCGMYLPIPSTAAKLAFRTILLIGFLWFTVRRDLPLTEIPYIGKKLKK